jgi:deoxyribose-phosphate aldolase
MGWTREQVSALIDHTLLKPEAGPADVAALVAEGNALGVYAVCVSPSLVSTAVGPLPVATVAGFPSGKHASEIKAAEARLAVRDGAAEVDMVIDVGAALAGDTAAVQADIAEVRAAIPDAVLKVIVESAVLLSLADADTLAAVCRAAEAAGADFVKTSTGFHPAGGASVPAVSASRPAAASVPRPPRWPCWTPGPPGWGCRPHATCSTGSDSLQPGQAGILAAAGNARFRHGELTGHA